MISRAWVASVVFLSVFAAAQADDPPDRFEKKPQPAEQRAPKKAGEKPSDDKDAAKTDPAEEAAKLREKIAEQMQAAEKKLKDRDPGKDTRQLQDDALRDIDRLIELARRPPPPPPPQPMDGSPPPMGGGQQPQGGQPQSQPGTQQRPQSGQARRERREQRRQQMEQQARGGGQQPQGGRPQPQRGGSGSREKASDSSGQPGTGGANAARQPDQLSDVVKDIWGHLPETMRQEVDHYYRDRFMPRYQDLLREYYQRLAERDRGRREDR
jgi:hypothetical protein